MARNAHPEVTRTRILDAAQRLFMAQGYEHTSIQNIVDELGDLSKGAIYHHFKSKEAILEELTNRDNNMQDDFNESVMNRTDLTALEKFRVLWRHSMTKHRLYQHGPLQLRLSGGAERCPAHLRDHAERAEHR